MVDSDVLTQYYKRLFPFKDLYSWLSYGDDAHVGSYFHQREIACTINKAGDPIYVRYQAFGDSDSFHKVMSSKCPEKIEIGAVYNHPPDQHQNFRSFAPIERELVFDIDMDDYNEVRLCCQGAKVCEKCWPLMTAAMGVLRTILKDDFGFEHLLFVFSGRRGVHCWVCDKRARTLTAEARTAIVRYLTVSGGGDSLSSRVKLRAPLHPSLRRIYEEILLPFWEEFYLFAQSFFETEKTLLDILSLCPESIRDELHQKWRGRPVNPRNMWSELKGACNALRKGAFHIDPLVKIVFAYTWPRIDANVSTSLNHLLKSPFCIHPATGSVSVPIDPDSKEPFSPKQAPTVHSLIEDINEYDSKNQDSPEKKDYKKTRLFESIQVFRRCFLRPLQASIRQELLHEKKRIRVGF